MRLGMSEADWAAFRSDFVQKCLDYWAKYPDRLRDVTFALLWSEGYTYEEMGTINDLHPTTVERNVDRFLQWVAAKMNDYDLDDGC